jgi:four helix bundle protein
LEVWRLSDQLRACLFDLTRRDPAVRDFDFRDQLRGAADSICRNIAEGSVGTTIANSYGT